MTKRLVVVNIALLAAAWYLGSRARDNWLEAKQRERVVLGRRVAPAPPRPYTPPQAPPHVTASEYADIAQATLMSEDRNPAVVVEVVPEKPMPALPALYGVFNLGEGPVAIMSAKQGERQKEIKPGEPVGDFKLVSVSPEVIVLEWEGKQVSKRTQDIIARAPTPAAAAVTERTAERPAARAAPAVAAAPRGPGVEMGRDMRTCVPNDSDPPGTVKDGFRKVVTVTPFGKACRWEMVR